MSFERDYLGAVSVASGAIKLIDAKDTQQADRDALRRALSIDGDPAGVGQSLTGGLYVGTSHAEGRYPVFGYRNEQGELTSIEIRLDEPEDT